MTLSKIKDMKKKMQNNPNRPTYKPPSRAKAKIKRFGPIPEIPVGTTFISRQECADAGVHGVIFQGIHPSPSGAYSVCLSGTYEEDEDNGETFTYTGSGGKEDSFSGRSKQVEHQNFSNVYNKSLKMSCVLGKPVRVIRGPNKKSKWAPKKGYRYDGIYRVTKYFYGKNASERRVCKYSFRRMTNQPKIPTKELEPE